MSMRQEHGQLSGRYMSVWVWGDWRISVDPLDIFNIALLGGSLPAMCHPSYTLLKVCVLVVHIRPWHVTWLSPLLRLVSWGAGPGVLSPCGLLSLRLDKVAAQAALCGRAFWHFSHLLLWSPNWLTTGTEDKQSPQEPIPLASLEWFR